MMWEEIKFKGYPQKGKLYKTDCYLSVQKVIPGSSWSEFSEFPRGSKILMLEDSRVSGKNSDTHHLRFLVNGRLMEGDFVGWNIWSCDLVEVERDGHASNHSG